MVDTFLFSQRTSHDTFSWMRVITAGTMFLVPLVLGPGIFFYYDVTPKFCVLLCGTAAAILVSRWDDVRSFAASGLGRCFTAAAGSAVLASAIAAAFASYPALSWSGSGWRRYGVLSEAAILLFAFLAAAAIRRNPETLAPVLRALVVAGLISGIYGIAQYAGFDPILDARGYHAGVGIYEIVRPPGTLGHSNYFAAFLLTSAFCGIGMFLTEKSGRWKAIAMAASIVSAGAIVLSGSRGALLGLCAGLVALAFCFRPRIRTVALSFCAIAVCSGLIYVSPFGGRLRARVHWIGEDIKGGARLWLWRDSLRMAADRPLFGYGPEAFNAAFPRYQSVELSQAYPDFYHESPHNMLLDTATSRGIVGLFADLLLFAVAGLAFRRARKVAPVIAPVLAAALCAGFVAHQFSVFVIPTGLAFLFLIAALVALAEVGTLSREKINVPMPAWTSGLWPVRAFGVVAVLGLACTVGCADLGLASVERQLDSGNPTAAVAAYRALTWQRAINVEADLPFSRRFWMSAQNAQDPRTKLALFNAAYAAGWRATTNPEQRSNAWYNMAELAAAARDPKLTEMALRAAIQCAPGWFKPHLALGRLLAMEGNRVGAAAELRRAEQLAGSERTEIWKNVYNLTHSASNAR